MKNSAVLDRNLLSLMHSASDTANALTYCNDSESIVFKESKTGHIIPLYERPGMVQKSIHSAFDPVREGYRLADQHQREGSLLIFGLGGGYHIRPFLKNKKITSIMIIENHAEEVRSILGSIDLSDIFLDKRVSLWILDDPEEFSPILLSKYIPVLSGNLQTVSLRSRVLLDQEFYSAVADVIKRTIGQITDDYTVQTHFGKKWFINTLSNLNASEKTTLTLAPIKKAFITAAGPSLEKQIPMLKDIGPSGSIIATDTSLPVLLSNDLKPDMVISIDCQHISYNHFMNGYPEDVPLILDLASPSFLTRIAKKTFFFTSGHPFSRYVSDEFREFPRIDTSGGNVTHAALSLADILGAREIYLLGADFSYPFGKPYARDSYIYPFFFAKALRLGGIESSIFSFVLHNKSINKVKTEEGFRYISKPMIHYKASIERKAAECRGKVIGVQGDGVRLNLSDKKEIRQREMRILSAGSPKKSYINFLQSYRDKIMSLPDVTVPVQEYLETLTLEEKEVWFTILPAAAQFRKKTDSGEEALGLARAWSLQLIDRFFSSEKNSPVIHKS